MNEIQTKNTASVEIPKDVHAKMKIHCAKLGIKIKVWLSKVIVNSIKNKE